MSLTIGRQCQSTERYLIATTLTFIGMNILIVFSLISFGGRSKDGLRQLLRFHQSGWHGYRMHRLRLFVFRPCRSGDIASNNGLDLDDFTFLHNHASAFELITVFVEASRERFPGFGRIGVLT